MSDDSAIVAARLRILDELHAAGVREWGVAFLALPFDEYRDALMCLALDRVIDGEVRGFKRRRKPALDEGEALDITKLTVGVVE